MNTPHAISASRDEQRPVETVAGARLPTLLELQSGRPTTWSPAIQGLPRDTKYLLSVVVVGLIDSEDPQLRVCGRIWPVPGATLEDCILVLEPNDARLRDVTGSEVGASYAWNEARMLVEGLYQTCVAVCPLGAEEKPIYEESAETCLMNEAMSAALDEACGSMRDRPDKPIYRTTLLSGRRFLDLNTNQTIVTFEGKRVLISGCGTGVEAAVILKLGAAQVLGVDSQPSHVALGKTRFAALTNMRLVTYDGKRIPQPDNSYDVVLSKHIIDHVSPEERAQYVAELFRILEPGGVILIDFPNQDHTVEPHAGLELFHQCPHAGSDEHLAALERDVQAGAGRADTLRPYESLRPHTNVKRQEFLTYLPPVATILNERRLDPFYRPIEDPTCAILRYELSKEDPDASVSEISRRRDQNDRSASGPDGASAKTGLATGRPLLRIMLIALFVCAAGAFAWAVGRRGEERGPKRQANENRRTIAGEGQGEGRLSASPCPSPATHHQSSFAPSERGTGDLFSSEGANVDACALRGGHHAPGQSHLIPR